MEIIEDKEDIKKIELKSKTGKVYFLEKRVKGGWKIERKETGSIENVSFNLVERIKERIESGEVISFREINYTVAVETAVLYLLRDIIHIDNTNKTYSKIKKNNKEIFSWKIKDKTTVIRFLSISLYNLIICVEISFPLLF